MTAKRVGIYARVSTGDQSTANQLIDLRRYTAQRSWTIVNEYVDNGISGAKERRPALDQLMTDARQRKLDVVLVWKFDRFARSAKHLLTALDEFKNLGVDFISVQDSIDTTSPVGRVVFTIIAAFAEFEREIIRQRVKDGVQKARERGQSFGRPKASFDIDLARKLIDQGRTYIFVGKALGVSRMTVKRALKKLAEAGRTQ